MDRLPSVLGSAFGPVPGFVFKTSGKSRFRAHFSFVPSKRASLTRDHEQFERVGRRFVVHDD
jgi:hypothetical protein